MASSPQRNPASAIRRILREWAEIEEDPNINWTARPINPDEPYEWHFTMRGPEDSAFSGGIYHGRLVLPVTYPMEPPSLYFLTVNGRFEVNKQVCLTATNFHPEEWQPAWGIRSILEALHAFFPAPAEGAVHSLDWSDGIRRDLAASSIHFVCPVCQKSNLLILRESLLPKHYIHKERIAPGPLPPRPTTSPSPPIEPPPPPAAENEEERQNAERARREVRSEPKRSGRALFGMEEAQKWVAFPIFIYWLLHFGGLELAAWWKGLSAQASSVFMSRTRGLQALTAVVMLCGLVWSSAELLKVAKEVWRETIFLHQLPINRIDQQTTVGDSTNSLTNAERFEDFPLSFLFM